MKLPETVKIGPATYRIRFMQELRNDKGANLAGQYLEHTREIRLLAGMPDDVTLVTFWHELTHALLTQAGLEHDEDVVVALSYGLVGMFEANGWAIAL